MVAKALGGNLTAADLQALASFETYQALSIGGSTAAPASAVTLPLPPSLGSAERVRRLSRETYGTPRADVEAALVERRKVAVSDAPIGSRKRQRPDGQA